MVKLLMCHISQVSLSHSANPGLVIVTIIHVTRLCVCCNMFTTDLLFIFTLTAVMGQRCVAEDTSKDVHAGDTPEDVDDLPDYIVPFTLIHRNQRSFFQPSANQRTGFQHRKRQPIRRQMAVRNSPDPVAALTRITNNHQEILQQHTRPSEIFTPPEIIYQGFTPVLSESETPVLAVTSVEKIRQMPINIIINRPE